MKVEPMFVLRFTRSGLEALLNALDTAYMYAPTPSHDEDYADALVQRVLGLLNNPDRQPNGT